MTFKRFYEIVKQLNGFTIYKDGTEYISLPVTVLKSFIESFDTRSEKET